MVEYNRMVKTTVYLDAEVAIALRQMAESEGRPQAELIREALASYAQQNKRPLPPGMGNYQSGRADVSERAEEILSAAAGERKWA